MFFNAAHFKTLPPLLKLSHIILYIWYSPLEGLFEVAIENWPEWDLNPRPLISTQMLYTTELSGHELNWHSE